ncbi:Acetoacetate metabolism regulatory protein AtoC [Planctomycetales bacterium 10988]|nr:Acetoacetate metabolism regulatory protein AtoC [Planctomycetales bacterium 10988]
MPTLLAIDDDPSVLLLLRRTFSPPQVELHTAQTAKEGLELAQSDPPDVIILDIVLPEMSGLECYQRLRDIDARIPVIFITASTNSSTAIEAMKMGAYDYVSKPLDVRHLRSLVNRAFEISRLMKVRVEVAENEQATEAEKQPDLLVGRCSAMQEVYKAIGRVAPQNITVLIQGETGTGKELVARAIYQYSQRDRGPFLAVNCAAIPDNLLESELFGYEKGAFTGADRTRIGKFEQCNHGTLFLDEIGDMSPLTQSKVLRLLQEQRFERLGGNETIHTDVRIIAATHRDLEEQVGRTEFREDLYYRLNVFTIRLPPLRERLEDMEPLVNHFIQKFSRALGKQVSSIATESMELLKKYRWPGNLRELESIIKQALVRATGPVLVPDFLPEELLTATQVAEPAAANDDHQFPDWQRHIQGSLKDGSENLYAETLELMERSLLTAVLKHTGGNQLQAAKILGITRGSLRNKIRSLGISIDRVIRMDED